MHTFETAVTTPLIWSARCMVWGPVNPCAAGKPGGRPLTLCLCDGISITHFQMATTEGILSRLQGVGDFGLVSRLLASPNPFCGSTSSLAVPSLYPVTENKGITEDLTQYKCYISRIKHNKQKKAYDRVGK